MLFSALLRASQERGFLKGNKVPRYIPVGYFIDEWEVVNTPRLSPGSICGSALRTRSAIKNTT
jgi:hypothetical protein